MAEEENKLANVVKNGGSLVTMTNDKQVQIAMMKPRDEEKVYQRAMKELELFPEAATSALYSIPYKNGDKTELVTGLSIKAAMSLARGWGNCSISSKIVPGSETDERILVSGIFIDYETNMGLSKEVSVNKKVYRKQYGKEIMLSADKLNIAIASGASKAMRNAILNGLPAYLVKAYEKKVKEMLSPSSKKAKEERVKDMYGKYASQGITKEILDKYMATNFPGMAPENLLDKMGGLYNSLEDGIIKKEHFSSEAPATEENSQKSEEMLNELTGETN